MSAWRNWKYQTAAYGEDSPQGKQASELLKVYQDQKLGVFFINRTSWKEPIVRRGVKLFREAVAGLQP